MDEKRIFGLQSEKLGYPAPEQFVQAIKQAAKEGKVVLWQAGVGIEYISNRDVGDEDSGYTDGK